MDGKRRGEVPRRLVRAASRLAAWRRTHVPHSRIPKVLWTAAVKLAADFGISRTATALRLNYYDLKKHVESQAPSQRAASAAKHATAFVELPSTLPLELPSALPVEWRSALPVAPECVIELENPAGSKMRIHLKGHHGPDLVALSRGFWSMPR
jgi:hypothetical protein